VQVDPWTGERKEKGKGRKRDGLDGEGGERVEASPNLCVSRLLSGVLLDTEHCVITLRSPLAPPRFTSQTLSSHYSQPASNFIMNSNCKLVACFLPFPIQLVYDALPGSSNNIRGLSICCFRNRAPGSSLRHICSCAVSYLSDLVQ